MEQTEEHRALYLKGIELFNDCEFFEAHDIWEELWTDYQGPSRKFYQGLIQTAVCLHHFVNENTRGAVKLYHSSRDYLTPYGPVHLGLDVERLLTEMTVCCKEIVQSEERFPKGLIDPDLIPDMIISEE